MTIPDVLSKYPNIDFGYTRTNIHTVATLPPGFRWADEVEVQYYWHIRGAVYVEASASIAIPI